MPDYSATAALISDIEARQDDLLRQLDELEKRIAAVLAEYAASCQPSVAGTARVRLQAAAAPVTEPATGRKRLRPSSIAA